MSSLRRIIFTLAALTTAACERGPILPTMPSPPPVPVEGNTGGLCVAKADFWAMWTATYTAPDQTIDVTAYRDPAPGCGSTRQSPLALRPYTYHGAKDVTFLLAEALQQDCGHVEFVMRVNGEFRANTMVDMTVACQ